MSGPELPLEDVEESWPVLESTDVLRGGAPFALRSDLVQRPGADDEEPFRRLVLEHPGAAVVLAVDDRERVLCLRQYRHATGRRFVELPAGLLDHPGEDPRAAAERELREEAALAASEWTPIGTTWPSPGILAEVHYYFLARGLSRVDRGDFELRHEEADMDSGFVAFEDLHRACLDGRVADAPAVMAVLMAHAKGLVGTGR